MAGRFAVLLSAILFTLSLNALAQISERGLSPDVATSLTKFGMNVLIGSADVISKAGKSDIKSPDAKELGKDLTELTDHYRTVMREANFSSSIMHDTGELIITTGQSLGTATGSAPVAAIAAVARYGNEKFVGYLESEAKERAIGLLAAGLQKMETSDKKTFDNLISRKNYKDAAKFFDDRTHKLTILKRSFNGDAGGIQAVDDLIIENLKSGSSAAIILAGAANAKAGQVETRLAEHITATRQFAVVIDSKLKTLKTATSVLQHSTDKIAGDIASLANDQKATSFQVGLIQDMLFDQQSPAVKLKMLEAGAKPGLTDDQKEKLSAYLKTEVRKQEILSTASDIVNKARDVNTILKAAKINDPRLSEAIQYGTVAQQALTQAFSGNYLGAIATVSGLFGGGQQEDPVQMQLGAISSQLKEIQKTLGEIIELQKETLRKIDALSRQLASVEKNLHERIDRVDFELSVLNTAVREILWKDFDSCGVSFDVAKNNRAYDFDDLNLRFRFAAGLEKFVTAQYGQAFLCASVLRQLFTRLGEHADLGSPIRLEYAASFIPETPPLGERSSYEKKGLESFLANVYKPSAEFVISSWKISAGNKPGWGSSAGVLGLLSVPAATAIELRDRIRKINLVDEKVPLAACSDQTLFSNRAKKLVCDNGTNELSATVRAEKFLREPIIRDQVKYLVQ